MSKSCVLKGGPYHGTQGEIGRPKPVLYFPETGGFAYVLTTPLPDDAKVLMYEFNEGMSPAVVHAKQTGQWDPTPQESMN